MSSTSPRVLRAGRFFCSHPIVEGPVVRSHRLVLAQIVQVVEAAGLKVGAW